MKHLEIKIGIKELSAETYDNGYVEITISQEHFGWNDGGKELGGSIILDSTTAKELLDFLKQSLEKKKG